MNQYDICLIFTEIYLFYPSQIKSILNTSAQLRHIAILFFFLSCVHPQLSPKLMFIAQY